MVDCPTVAVAVSPSLFPPVALILSRSAQGLAKAARMAPYRPARVLITATCSLAMLTAGLKGALSQAELDLGFVLQGEPVPPNTLRIVALGTGTPFVRRSQVATSYLLQLGGTRNILFDIGTGSIVNLYAAGVDLSTVDTVKAVQTAFASVLLQAKAQLSAGPDRSKILHA